MPKVVSNVVDTYVFRRTHGGAHFLVIRKRSDAPAGNIWQAIHSQISAGETALSTALHDVVERTGLTPDRCYTADYVGQFYDHVSDSIILAPTLAAQVGAGARVRLSTEYVDYAWCDLEETTSRLTWSAQRWAVRHIFDLIVADPKEADIYAVWP